MAGIPSFVQRVHLLLESRPDLRPTREALIALSLQMDRDGEEWDAPSLIELAAEGPEAIKARITRQQLTYELLDAIEPGVPAPDKVRWAIQERRMDALTRMMSAPSFNRPAVLDQLRPAPDAAYDRLSEVLLIEQRLEEDFLKLLFPPEHPGQLARYAPKLAQNYPTGPRTDPDPKTAAPYLLPFFFAAPAEILLREYEALPELRPHLFRALTEADRPDMERFAAIERPSNDLLNQLILDAPKEEEDLAFEANATRAISTVRRLLGDDITAEAREHYLDWVAAQGTPNDILNLSATEWDKLLDRLSKDEHCYILPIWGLTPKNTGNGQSQDYSADATKILLAQFEQRMGDPRFPNLTEDWLEGQKQGALIRTLTVVHPADEATKRTHRELAFALKPKASLDDLLTDGDLATILSYSNNWPAILLLGDLGLSPLRFQNALGSHTIANALRPSFSSPPDFLQNTTEAIRRGFVDVADCEIYLTQRSDGFAPGEFPRHIERIKAMRDKGVDLSVGNNALISSVLDTNRISSDDTAADIAHDLKLLGSVGFDLKTNGGEALNRRVGHLVSHPNRMTLIKIKALLEAGANPNHELGAFGHLALHVSLHSEAKGIESTEEATRIIFSLARLLADHDAQAPDTALEQVKAGGPNFAPTASLLEAHRAGRPLPLYASPHKDIKHPPLTGTEPNFMETYEVRGRDGTPKQKPQPTDWPAPRRASGWANIPPQWEDLTRHLMDEMGPAGTHADGEPSQAVQTYINNYALLFQTPGRALRYLKTCWTRGQIDPRRGKLHEAAQFSLPPTSAPIWDMEAWGNFAIKHGLPGAALAVHAHRIGQPTTLAETRAKAATLHYERGKEHPELASLCRDHDIDEETFELALTTVKSRPPGGSTLPDIVVREGDLTMRRLPPGDIRGLFLGEITDCCQSLGSPGASCALHGFLRPDSGFYVVEDRDGAIIGQAFSSLTPQGLLLDSLESLKGRMQPAQWVSLLTKATHATGLDISVGTGGATPLEAGGLLRANPLPLKHSGYSGYSDADEQLLLRYPRNEIDRLLPKLVAEVKPKTSTKRFARVEEAVSDSTTFSAEQRERYLHTAAAALADLTLSQPSLGRDLAASCPNIHQRASQMVAGRQLLKDDVEESLRPPAKAVRPLVETLQSI